MAFALDDNEIDQDDEIQEGDGEGPYNVTDDSESGEETTEKLWNRRKQFMGH